MSIFRGVNLYVISFRGFESVNVPKISLDYGCWWANANPFRNNPKTSWTAGCGWIPHLQHRRKQPCTQHPTIWKPYFVRHQLPLAAGMINLGMPGGAMNFILLGISSTGFNHSIKCNGVARYETIIGIYIYLYIHLFGMWDIIYLSQSYSSFPMQISKPYCVRAEWVVVGRVVKKQFPSAALSPP